MRRPVCQLTPRPHVRGSKQSSGGAQAQGQVVAHAHSVQAGRALSTASKRGVEVARASSASLSQGSPQSPSDRCGRAGAARAMRGCGRALARHERHSLPPSAIIARGRGLGRYHQRAGRRRNVRHRFRRRFCVRACAAGAQGSLSWRLRARRPHGGRARSEVQQGAEKQQAPPRGLHCGAAPPRRARGESRCDGRHAAGTLSGSGAEEHRHAFRVCVEAPCACPVCARAQRGARRAAHKERRTARIVL